MRTKFSFLFLFFFSLSAGAQQKTQASTAQRVGQRWTTEKAVAWYNQHQWITGANYLPAIAINQLEMWQPETFDTADLRNCDKL